MHADSRQESRKQTADSRQQTADSRLQIADKRDKADIRHKYLRSIGRCKCDAKFLCLGNDVEHTPFGMRLVRGGVWAIKNQHRWEDKLD
jgi:hypothetical protein